MNELHYQIDLLKAVNQKLSDSEKIYKTISEISNDAYIYFNQENSSLIMSDSCQELFHIRKSALYNVNTLLEAICETDREIVVEAMKNHDNERDSIIEFQLLDEKTWVQAKITFYYKNQNDKSLILCFQDITKAKLRNSELQYMAYYDSLTGLLNRNCFVKKLTDFIMHANHQDVISVCYIDIDDFKKINDGLGILLGDEVVQGFGRLLHEFENEHIIVGRINNDEFCMAVKNPFGNRQLDYIYKQIKERLKSPLQLSNGAEVHITVSAGIADYPEAGNTALDLIKNAQVMMFEIKASGKNNLKYFNQSILNDFINQVTMEKKMKSAIRNENFMLYYQPQYGISNGELRGAEALIRWVDEDGNFISPNDFIRLSEKTGDIIAIGRWVMREALKMKEKWKNDFSFSKIMSINISALQLEDEDFLPYLLRLVKEYNISANEVELEITESVFINNFEKTLNIIKKIRNFGFKISLDDFGTGYSSLSYLKDLPIDTLKIDKSFIDTAISDKSTNIITESVVFMVKRLGLETVAEGVETKEQYDYLKTIQCDNIQGFFLGRPLTELQMESLIQTKL